MTDETRPETTPPTPDGDKPGSAEKADSLDSWFRPGRAAEAESEQETPPEAEVGEGDEGEPAGRSNASNASDTSDDGERADRVDRVESGSAEPKTVASKVESTGVAPKAGEPKTVEVKAGESKGAAPGRANDLTQVIPADLTQVIPAATAKPASSPASADNDRAESDRTDSDRADGDRTGNDRTQVFPATPPAPANPVAAAPTQAIPRASVPSAAKPSAETPSTEKPGTGTSGVGAASGGAESQGAGSQGAESWSPAPGPQPQYKAPQPQERQEPWQPQRYQPTQQAPAQHQPEQYQEARRQQAPAQYQQSESQSPSQAQGQLRQRPYQQQSQTRPYEAPGGVASILPPRGHGDDYDDFDNYSYADGAPERRRGRARPALLAIAGVFVLIVAVAAALVFSGKVHVFGVGAKPVPTVGFSPSGSDAGSDATQTGTAFLTDWENGNLAAAANITDNQSAALAALTAYKSDLKVSGLTLMPGTASAQGWMTFNVTAQVGAPSSAWSYSSGMATYSSSINGYTRWFVKWQPSLMFTSLTSGQKLALGAIPPVANKVVDSSGTEITSANAPSLNGIVSALKKSAPPAAGTPGQQVQIENADGSVVSKVAKLSDPVTTGAVKTTINLNVQKAAQSAVNQAPNSSMVVIQPSTGNILAVANNPTTGLDTAMLGKYAPGSTFKTITSTLVLNKGVISDLNQTWDCPATLNTDGITLHNSEQEQGMGNSFLTDFAASCNNAFSRFGAEGKVSRDELVSTAHDYYGFDQKWDVGLSAPTIYGHVPNTSSNSLAEELVGQDQIQANPLIMASVAATVDNGSFKQPILVPGTAQISATPLPAKTDADLKTLMHQVVVSGTLANILPVDGVYAKTGTAEVQGKTPNSWTIAFRGDYAVAALAVGGNFGATTAGPEVKSLLAAVP